MPRRGLAQAFTYSPPSAAWPWPFPFSVATRADRDQGGLAIGRSDMVLKTIDNILAIRLAKFLCLTKPRWVVEICLKGITGRSFMSFSEHKRLSLPQAGPSGPAGVVPVFYGYFWRSSP